METLTFPHVVRHKKTGALLVAKERLTNQDGIVLICSPINNRWVSGGYFESDIEAAPPRKPGAPFDFETEISPRAQGALPWEIVEPASLAQTLSNVAACAGWECFGGTAYVTKPGRSHADWARIFLHTTQSGGYTGQAHALVWESGAPVPKQSLQRAVIDAAVAAVHAKAPPGDLAAAVLAMEGASWQERESVMPSAWLLSICRHEIVSTGTAEQRQRGWHPAHCSKCGLNLSVDSSD